MVTYLNNMFEEDDIVLDDQDTYLQGQLNNPIDFAMVTDRTMYVIRSDRLLQFVYYKMDNEYYADETVTYWRDGAERHIYAVAIAANASPLLFFVDFYDNLVYQGNCLAIG